MKTLYIMRHGKSSWEGRNLKDFERPLLTTGEKRTKRISQYLLDRAVAPDLIISSHAVRAFETATLIASALNYPRHKIQIESQVYHNGTEGLWSLIFSLPDEKDNVMIVGHNPALTQFVNGLLDEPVDYLPTSAVVSISFKTNKWNELFIADKRINFITYPNQLEKI
jgi:phosphohistidine phosphatase